MEQALGHAVGDELPSGGPQGFGQTRIDVDNRGVQVDADGNAHLGIELAVVLHLDRRQVIGIAGDQVAEPAQQMPALGGIDLGPFAALEGRTRSTHGLVDIAGIAFGHIGPLLRSEGVCRFEHIAGFSCDPATVDKTAVILDAFNSGHIHSP